MILPARLLPPRLLLPSLRRRARRLGPTLALAAASLALAAPSLPPQPAHAAPQERPTLVRTADGWVRGERTDEGRQFLGIPYAQPPTGQLRWRPPRPAAAWDGVREATAYGNDCAQNTYWAPGHEKQRTTEGCLDVNVFTPAAAHRTSRLPVMVWIHGGANIGGAARDILPDTFARRTGTVVVTLNYRLGASGFLTLPGTTGNFALLDQQQALRWVQNNIGRFGGDRHRVTLAGESAGGGAVCSQLAAPGSHGLYRAAIIQSGAFGDCAGRPRDRAEAAGLAFAKKLGCTQPSTAAACLRSRPIKEVLDAQEGTGASDWTYTTGTQALPEPPADAFAAGRAARVPVMNGANSHEGLVFAYDSFDRWGRPLTKDAYPGALTSAFGEHTGAKALKRYPSGTYERPGYAYAAAFGDQLFACPALRVDAALARRGQVYAYEFADRSSPLFASLPQNADFDFGATHAAELNYLFKPYGRAAAFDAGQKALSAQMTAYWGSFLHGSPPGAPGQRDMPEQSREPGHVLQLRTTSAGGTTTTPHLAQAHHCDLWDDASATP
ncbi:carboxylesterase/lipase family protein [Streptomyces monticola]|uniref:Carboxylic ester hydrolase n=1 Tax=Streptomyces monticola TaxID=2666263 RepID=A0ABW2JDB5_9ACTN